MAKIPYCLSLLSLDGIQVTFTTMIDFVTWPPFALNTYTKWCPSDKANQKSLYTIKQQKELCMINSKEMLSPKVFLL